jgi:hypothetical protein
MNRFQPLEDVYVYDNVLSLTERDYILKTCRNSNFNILGWQENSAEEGYVHSAWSNEDLVDSGFLSWPGINKIMKERGLSIEQVYKVVINVDTLSDSHWPHTHNGVVLLYYLNLEWLEGWGGETLFYDTNSKEVIYGSKFTPNRVIIFDGGIPHNIKHQNRIADKYRMSLSIFFNKEVNNE